MTVKTALAAVPDFFEFHAKLEADLAYGEPQRCDQRRGQYAYNQLQRIRPELAERIAGSVIDPYYSDAMLDGGEFYDWLMNTWEDDDGSS